MYLNSRVVSNYILSRENSLFSLDSIGVTPSMVKPGKEKEKLETYSPPRHKNNNNNESHSRKEITSENQKLNLNSTSGNADINMKNNIV